jgi:hypothetical protein
MNTKHAEILKELHIEKRKRGRPRKYVLFLYNFLDY